MQVTMRMIGINTTQPQATRQPQQPQQAQGGGDVPVYDINGKRLR